MAEGARIVDCNRRRSACQYHDHLKSMVDQLVYPDMDETKWNFLMRCHGAQFARKQPNAGEESDDADPQFAEKREIYSKILQYARHRYRPGFNVAVQLNPPEHVPNPAANLPPFDPAAENEVPVDEELERLKREVAALGVPTPRGNDSDEGASDSGLDGVNADPPPGDGGAAEEPRDGGGAAAPRTVGPAKKARAKKNVSFDGSSIGSRPVRPPVAPRVKLPPRKDLCQGPVSTKKGEKDWKLQLNSANARIGNLESYINTALYPRYQETHGQLASAVDSGWDCIEQQDLRIRFLEGSNNELNKELLDFRHTVLDKDILIAQLQAQLVTANRTLEN